MTLRRWTILSVILLVPGFVLQFLSRTVFVPEAGVIGGLLPAKVAGVDEIIMTTPPGKDGKVNPGTLVLHENASRLLVRVTAVLQC